MAPKSSLKTSSSALNELKFNRNYFQLPHPGWMLLITFGIWLLAATTFAPKTIPDFLGPVGQFGKYMSQYHNFCVFLCAFTVVAHVLEAAYAGKICQDKSMTTGATIKWVISTFFFGFASLSLRLLAYKGKRTN